MASLWISPVAVPEPVPSAPLSRQQPVRRPAARPAPRPHAGASVSPVRWTYVRRRAVAVALICGAFLLGWQALAALGRTTVSEPTTQWRSVPDVPVAVHNAAPGETLWDLAVAYGPDDDVRRSLDVLIVLNGGSALVAGEPVRVPRAWLEVAG